VDEKRLKELHFWKTRKLGQVFYNADPAGIYAKYWDDRMCFLTDPVYKPDTTKFPAFDNHYDINRAEVIYQLVEYLELLEEFYELRYKQSKEFSPLTQEIIDVTVDAYKQRTQKYGEEGMIFEEAKEELKEYIQPDGGLFCLGHYLAWTVGDDRITLDCGFEQKELEAIAVYMRDYPTKTPEER